MTSQQRKEYQARQERLKRVAENIDRGVNGPFFGADFHLGFNFMFGEIIELQREFNERFSDEMPDPRFSEFYNRIIQIMESSKVVLMDSIDPNAAKKHMADLAERNQALLNEAAALESKAKQGTLASKQWKKENDERDAKKNKRSTFRKGTGGKTIKLPTDKEK